MSGFFSNLVDEMGARRKRMRAMMGDRGQALVEFLVLGGLMLGSVGLFVRPWMLEAAPWGPYLLLLFPLGYLAIELRRQRTANAENVATYDWTVLLWSFACALAGAAAFVIAWGAEPAPAPEAPTWTPPESAVDSTLETVEPD